MKSTFYIPTNLDIDLIIPKGRKDLRENLKWSVCFILNSLYKMSINKKYRDEFEEQGGYPLNATVLKQTLGKRYNEAFKILKSAKIITRSTSYTVGKQSKVVGLSNPYSDNSFKKVTLTATTPFCKKLSSVISASMQKNDEALKELSFITKWFSSDYLELDIEKAHVFIEFYRSEMFNLLDGVDYPIEEKEVIKQRINARTNSMISTADNFSKKEYSLYCKGKDQRLHSILTSTKKELRTLYTFKEQPLVAIDIKASQPYLLNTLLDPDFWEKKLEKIYSNLHNHLNSPTFRFSHLLPIMLLTSETTKSHLKEENTRYQDLNWSDGFYEYLMIRDTANGDSKLFTSRGKTKKSVMNMLYNQENYMEHTPELIRFKSWFPEIAKLVSILNSLSRKVSDLEKKKVSFLPVLLQRIESSLVLKTICKRIADEYPEVPLYPIHDSILTTKENVHIVKSMMEKELSNFVKVKAGLSTEEYNESFTFENLRSIANEDFSDILKKRKLFKCKIKLRKPLLYSIPKWGESQIISTRFLPEDMALYEFDRAG